MKLPISDGKESACNAGDLGSIPGSGRSPGTGNDNPLQYSCLENSMDRRAWGATVHGVTKSRTRLSDCHFHYAHFFQKVGSSYTSSFVTCLPPQQHVVTTCPLPGLETPTALLMPFPCVDTPCSWLLGDIQNLPSLDNAALNCFVPVPLYTHG